MKIVIDCRFWGPTHTGLGVYTANLVRNLAKIDSENGYVLLVRKEAEVGRLPENFTTEIVEASAYSLKEQLLLPVKLIQINPDLVHFPSINVPILYFGRYVVTVHDLIKHYFRGTETSTHGPVLYWFKYFIYLLVTWWGVNFSRKIIVPSKNVKNVVRDRYQVSGSKVVPTYEAATVTQEIGEKKIILPDKFAIYAGNAYPHKNLPNLFAAWRKIYARTGVKLVIACGRSVFTRKYEKLIYQEKGEEYISFFGYLSESQLKYAYKRATVYVFPTLMEGFGIPGLDAMTMKLPVVCSDIEVLREIYGQAAQYFDPKNTEDMADKIINVISDNKLRKDLMAKGLVQARKYSWEKMARETLRVYENSAGLRSS